MHPKEVRLDRSHSHLSVIWENGTTTTYPAALLRQNARDAGSVRAGIDGRSVVLPPILTITSVEPVGNYGLRLAFSDGHDRGIFPWSHLATINVDRRARAAAH